MTTDAEPKPRLRKFRPKTRTGCRNCKLRHIKCTEERPSCQRCVSTGRRCEGYETMRVAQTSTNANGVLTLTWAAPSSQPPETDSQEQSAFHCFRMRVVDDLSGPFDPSVWYRLVLPVSMTEPAVRHAVIALGSLGSSDHGARTRENDKFALRHYSKAMTALQKQIAFDGQASPILTLVTCLLFVAFEFQQSGWVQAKSHALGGLNIVRELRHNHSFSKESDIEPLTQAFERLDIQLSLSNSSRVNLNQASDDGKIADLQSDMYFSDVASASRMLNLQLAAMRELVFKVEALSFSGGRMPLKELETVELQITRQLASLSHWDHAMKQLYPRLPNTKDQQAARTLRMHQICCKLMISTCLSDGRELMWDRYFGDFGRLLDLAESVLHTVSSLPSKSGLYTSGFSLDMGIIPPSYFTAIKCRDPKLRKRALDVLRSCKHQEGAWDGPTTATMAETIVQLEGGLVDVPERSRLYRGFYDLDASGLGIVYCKRRRFETDGSWIEYLERIE